MSMIKAISDHLKNDSAVTSQLSSYDFGSGNQPAIFSLSEESLAPKDAATPLVTISQTGGPTDGDRGHRGALVEMRVVVWGVRGDSMKIANDVAMTVWESLNRAVVSVEGYEVVSCIADPPLEVADPDGYPGYRVECRVRIREELSSS